MKRLVKIASIVLLVFITPAILSLVFFNFYSILDVPNNATKMSYPLLLIPIAILLATAIFFFVKIFKKLTKAWVFFIAATAAIFILQIMVMMLTKPMPSFDAASLIATAFNDQEVGYNFFVNSNNSFLGMIYLVLKDVLLLFFGGDLLPVFMYSIIVISLLCVSLSVLGVTWLADQLFSRKIAVVTFVLSASILLISPNMLIPYSDTFAMPFVVAIIIISLIIYRHLKTQPDNNRRIVPLIILLFAIATIGYLIKPTVIFALIPCLLVGICLLNKKNIRDYMGVVIALAVVAPVSVLAIKYLPVLSAQYIYAKNNIEMPAQTIKDHSATFLHFLSTGTNPNFGYYDSESADNLYSTNSQSEINHGSVEIISKRIDEQGLLWYFGLLAEKNIMNLSDGTFFYGEFGGNLDASAPFSEIQTSGALFEYIYPRGKVYRVYKYLVNAIWLLILIGVTVSLIVNLKARRKILFITQLSLLLLLIFLMFFEARSRYLILFLPAFVLLGAFGLAALSDKIQRLSAKWRS
jgi:hypothetical protein